MPRSSVHPGERISEAELQAYLWGELKKRGLDARCAVSLPSGVADIVVFSLNAVALIIELKAGGSMGRTAAQDQVERYLKQVQQVRMGYTSSGIVIRGRTQAMRFLDDLDEDPERRGVWQFNGCIITYWTEGRSKPVSAKA